MYIYSGGCKANGRWNFRTPHREERAHSKASIPQLETHRLFSMHRLHRAEVNQIVKQKEEKRCSFLVLLVAVQDKQCDAINVPAKEVFVLATFLVIRDEGASNNKESVSLPMTVGASEDKIVMGISRISVVLLMTAGGKRDKIAMETKRDEYFFS